jgi:DNA-binding response OmpR family regulator
MTPLNVLLAGEDDVLRQALPLLLPGRVSLVDRSTDPEHIRRLAEQRWPHLVLLDLDWPGAADLAGDLRQAGAPVILLASAPRPS